MSAPATETWASVYQKNKIYPLSLNFKKRRDAERSPHAQTGAEWDAIPKRVLKGLPTPKQVPKGTP